MDTQMPPMDPGQFVDLVVEDPEAPDQEIVWLAKIKSTGEGAILISEPQRDGQVMPVPELPFEVTCRIPQEAIMWSFPSAITSVMGDTYLLAMPNQEEIQREPRRSHVRANVNLQVQASVIMANRSFADQTIEIIDISGGGCQMSAARPFISNAVLRVKIPLPQKTIEVQGKVVRPNPFPQGLSKRTYISGLAFTKISEVDRELLIKFIFDKMREDLKQGKVF